MANYLRAHGSQPVVMAVEEDLERRHVAPLSRLDQFAVVRQCLHLAHQIHFRDTDDLQNLSGLNFGLVLIDCLFGIDSEVGDP